jgi:hypothetical protein
VAQHREGRKMEDKRESSEGNGLLWLRSRGSLGGVSCGALPMPAAWAGELIRHSNRQSVQSRDTAATFLEVCMARWVGAWA